jgi:hypothetical protein
MGSLAISISRPGAVRLQSSTVYSAPRAIVGAAATEQSATSATQAPQRDLPVGL